jgi:hypothetical protein
MEKTILREQLVKGVGSLEEKEKVPKKKERRREIEK